MSSKQTRRKPRQDMTFAQERKDWKLPWHQYEVNGATLEYQAVHYLPTGETLEEFEEMEWTERQLVLARLRRRESEVNTKALPIIAPLVALLIVLFNVLLGVVEKGTVEFIIVLAFINASVVGLAFTAAIGVTSHNKKDACFTAWVEAFEDVHALKTKKEEEGRKAGMETGTNRPAIARYGWAVKFFG
ncbi:MULTISPECIES: hypothetical protein [unclassified Pseudarthrobacter]|uniref:hypothetical protein n=1 Tax=unclassified Pseudarthrobacter TaxID=2647000 RepID=UPI0030789393